MDAALQRIRDTNADIDTDSFNIVGQEATPRALQHETDALKERADQESAFTFDRMGRENLTYQLMNRGIEGLVYDDDPDFDPNAFIPELEKQFPVEYIGHFAQAGSIEELEGMKDKFRRELDDSKLLEHMGFRGAAAQMLGAVLDPATIAAGLLGGAGKVGRATQFVTRSKRLGNAAQYGYVGAVEAGASEIGLSLMRQDRTIENLPDVMLMGAAFGGTLGVFSKEDLILNKRINEMRKATLREHDNELNDIHDADEFAASMVADLGRMEQAAGKATINPDASMGAASTTPNLNVSSETARIVKGAQEYMRTTDVASRELSLHSPSNSGVTKLATKMQEYVNKVPWLKSDFWRGFESDSAVIQATTHKLLEDSTGMYRNSRSGALLQEKYRGELARFVMPTEPEQYAKWLKATGSQKNEISRQAFWKEVMREMDARYFDGRPATTNEQVRFMADQWDAMNKHALDRVMRGRNGEGAVRGSENLEHYAGWRPFRWRYDNMAELRRNGVTEEQLIAALSDGYSKQHKSWSPEVTRRVATSVIRRVSKMGEGFDTNLHRLLEQEGVEFMRDFFKNADIPEKDIDALVDGLRGIKKDDTKVRILKSRNEIDPRTPIPGTKFTLADMMDSNMPRLVESYGRQAAGAGAMARHGIQRDMKNQLKEAAKSELLAKNSEADVTWVDDYFDGMFAGFGGGALAGGLNPWVRRGLMGSNLAMLNQMGIPQMAELGAAIGAFGIKTFIDAAPDAIRSILKGEKFSPAMAQLADSGTYIRGEHLMTRPELLLDEWRANPAVQMEAKGFLDKAGEFIDKAGAKGQRLQGYMSLFYKVRQFQHEMVGRMYIQHMGKLARGEAKINPERIYDMGFTDAKQFDRIMNKFKNNVEMRDGKVFDLKPEDWSYEDWEAFTNAHVRVSNQLVQKAMRGEDMLFLHKDVGAILGHLKSFPLVAMNKQLLRNMRLADTETMGTAIYGLVTAATMYTAKQYVNGNSERVTPENVFKGAVGMANFSSPVVMITDPLAAVLGMDALRFNTYTRPGTVGAQVLPSVPAYDTLERMVHVPHSIFSVMSGNYEKSDVTALQAIPIIGNAYGMTAIFNGMKDEVTERKAAERKQAAQAKQIQNEAKTVRVNMESYRKKNDTEKAATRAFVSQSTGLSDADIQAALETNDPVATLNAISK